MHGEPLGLFPHSKNIRPFAAFRDSDKEDKEYAGLSAVHDSGVNDVPLTSDPGLPASAMMRIAPASPVSHSERTRRR
jgi:hypothetical protein